MVLESSVEAQLTAREYKGRGEKEKQNRGWGAYRRKLGFFGDAYFESFLATHASVEDQQKLPRVLDLGSGKGVFREDCLGRGLQIEMVNLDIQYLDPDYLEGVAKKRENVTVDWEALPFADDSFDTIISAGAFPLWARKNAWEQILTDLIRVLKPGGKIRVKSPPDSKLFRSCLQKCSVAIEFRAGLYVDITKKASSASSAH